MGSAPPQRKPNLVAGARDGDDDDVAVVFTPKTAAHLRSLADVLLRNGESGAFKAYVEVCVCGSGCPCCPGAPECALLGLWYYHWAMEKAILAVGCGKMMTRLGADGRSRGFCPCKAVACLRVHEMELARCKVPGNGAKRVLVMHLVFTGAQEVCQGLFFLEKG